MLSRGSSIIITLGVCALATAALPTPSAYAQAYVGSATLRPFVTSWIPVIGRGGAIGGVLVDADGVVTRATGTDDRALRDAWFEAAKPIRPEFNRPAKMRMVSLRCIEAALAEHVEAGKPVPDELFFLGGLQRVEYVLVYPDRNDIVLAGPADGWRLGEGGVFVGTTTGAPLLRLDDFVDALRVALAGVDGKPISCSIDPTEEGLIRLQQVLGNRNLQFNQQTLQLMEQALGPQDIRVTGVPNDSHFARVMVAADFLMKRLAMGFEKAPVGDLPSYMDMLKAQPRRRSQIDSPRWWLAVDSEPVRASRDGLAWQLSSVSVKTMTEDGYLDASGRLVEGLENPVAEKWADAMTANYDELSETMPVFAELRNAMNLSIAAALIAGHDLPGRAGCDLPYMGDARRTRGPAYQVPKSVASQATFLRATRGWLVSISGGVDIDQWSPLARTTADDKLAGVRTEAAPSDPERWWWE